MNPEIHEFHREELIDKLRSRFKCDDWSRFDIGQEFTLNGVLMRIRKITKKDIVLRPVKQG